MTNLAQQLAGTPEFNESAAQYTQTQLIREIQMRRGEEPCFASEIRNDCAEICEWRRECRPRRAAWQR